MYDKYSGSHSSYTCRCPFAQRQRLETTERSEVGPTILNYALTTSNANIIDEIEGTESLPSTEWHPGWINMLSFRMAFGCELLRSTGTQAAPSARAP